MRLEELQQRFDHEAALRKEVALRVARRRPAAAREVILQAIQRQMITVLAGDDFGGDAAVVLVAFDDPGRTFGRVDAAL